MEGNQQKMREALRAALEKVNEIYDVLSRPCIVVEEARQACREARGVLIPALAKPPRNCDLFGGDPKMLRTAWFDWSGSPSGRNPDGTVKLTFGEWLIATATGENKA